MGPSILARLRAAAVRPRPGDEQVAPERREQHLPAGRRLHQSDLEAAGGGSREEARRNLAEPACLIRPRATSVGPEGCPSFFWNIGMQMLQQPDKITILYSNDHEVRHVRMNQPHPARVTPSWYGDSVGHYEGDTLVIDTVGIKIGPFAMVDMYGTPHSPGSARGGTLSAARLRSRERSGRTGRKRELPHPG